VTRPGTLAWFAQHESRLAWRDWVSMITAGKRARERTVAITLIAFAAFMHLVAYSLVARYANVSSEPGTTALLAISGSLLLAFSLMVSQAMESVMRVLYTRSDLDLILSSPVTARLTFVVRIATTALSVIMMALLLGGPFINVLVLFGGPRWLAGYGVVVALGATAAALALALSVALFHAIGPKRARLVAQVVAAVIGAAFVIGLQIAAVSSYGTISRTAVLESDALAALAPDAGSVVWWPARAILGDLPALAAVVGFSLALLGAATVIFSQRLGDHVIAASGVASTARRQARRSAAFRSGSARQTLRRNEWMLLRRDPWLVSQTLMQMLYLVPPALLLWKSFAEGSRAPVLLVPVLVMAAGQLAGGLAWLAISGEDAPDLVSTAPIPAAWIQRAKIESVMGVIAWIFAPLVAALLFIAPGYALVAAIGVTVAAASSTAIQLWFRTQAKRSHFRRRQTSSRMATFAEAFASTTWAATAALAASGAWFAVITGGVAVLILVGARVMSPARTN
jgi:ABC-2 type transport system permease protein